MRRDGKLRKQSEGKAQEKPKWEGQREREIFY